MKNSILIFAILVVTNLHVFGQTSPSDAILGYYFNQEKVGKVQIYKQGEKYYGKLYWMKTPRKDNENPDAKLKSRDLEGTVILKDLKFNGKTWEGGTIYDPKNGKTYSCAIKTKGANELDIRGYIGISLIGRSSTFTRTSK